MMVAMSVAFVIRDALVRLGYNLAFVIGGVILVFCSHTLIPFQAHQQLAIVGWAYVAVTFVSILAVLMQIKRDEIIARLMSPGSGNRAIWDSEFVLKVAVFALLPLLLLFAAQFPDIGGTLLQLLEPVEKALP